MDYAPVHVSTGKWVSKGWEIFKQDMGNFVLVTLIFLALVSFANIIVAGPLTAGFFLTCLKRMNKGKADLSDLFNGFNFFFEALIASLVISVFIGIGFVFCIVPALVVYAMYLFTYLFMVDRKLDFWQSMEASRKLVANDYFGFSLFALALLFINLLGGLALGVGLFFTIPWTKCAITVAYQELVGFQEQVPISTEPIKIP